MRVRPACRPPKITPSNLPIYRCRRFDGSVAEPRDQNETERETWREVEREGFRAFTFEGDFGILETRGGENGHNRIIENSGFY